MRQPRRHVMLDSQELDINRILVLCVLIFIAPFAAFTQNSSYEANVSADSAVFTFPINPRQKYTWSNGGLAYKWSIAVRNNGKNYDFGFYLFTPMGASLDESGDINALLRAGQFSAWNNDNVISNIRVEGSANQTRDRLTIKVSGRVPLQLLFSGKPQFVTFSNQLGVDAEPTNNQVRVSYAGESGGGAVPAPPSERLIGFVQKEHVVDGCGATYSIKGDTSRPVFSDDFGDNIWMNIAGQDIKLKRVSSVAIPAGRPRRGQRITARYQAPGITVQIDDTLTKVPVREGDEDTEHAATITVIKGGSRQSVQVVGSSGC